MEGTESSGTITSFVHLISLLMTCQTWCRVIIDNVYTKLLILKFSLVKNTLFLSLRDLEYSNLEILKILEKKMLPDI